MHKHACWPIYRHTTAYTCIVYITIQYVIFSGMNEMAVQMQIAKWELHREAFSAKHKRQSKLSNSTRRSQEEILLDAVCFVDIHFRLVKLYSNIRSRLLCARTLEKSGERILSGKCYASGRHVMQPEYLAWTTEWRSTRCQTIWFSSARFLGRVIS